jgi:serine/threonine protein kinase/tetratricopeptide (TPR) repeat protein
MPELSAPNDVAVESLVARVLDEFRERQQRGERPDVEEYVSRHPEAADLLRKVLAAFQLLEVSLCQDAPAAGVAEETLAGTLGDFRLLREVGRGGMGIVYEAQQISLGRRVALKVLPFAATMDPRQLQRFHNEARAAACLHHPHIVPVHGVGHERGVHYYAMQFIDGITLAHLIAQQHQPGEAHEVRTTAFVPADPAAPTIPAANVSTQVGPRDAGYYRQVAQWGIEAAEALEHAHSLGIVHRDVKPGNLMLDVQGRLWVTDFGLARTADSGLTMSGDLLGTLRYMSPEQALARHGLVDHRADVYSLGATLYELLTLRPALAGSDRQELLRQIAFEEPVTPRKLERSIPAELETIVLKAMEKNPTHRYATAKELADDLRHWLEDRPIRARRPSWRQVAIKWARRHKPLVVAAAVVVTFATLVLAGATGWVANDRATRKRDAEEKVREALDAAGPMLRQGNPRDPVLISAFLRAEAQLGSGLVGEELRRRVERLRKDMRMLEDLEMVRLEKTETTPDGKFDLTRSRDKYEQVFRDYGIDPDAMSPGEAAELVRASAIRGYLAAGLCDWIFTIRPRNEGNRRKVKQLHALVQQVYPDQEVRILDLPKDTAELERWVQSAPVARMPAANLGLVGEHVAFRAGSVTRPMVEFLRRSQRRFPSDFWINHSLGIALTRTKPPQLEQAVGFYRAALAVRPQSPGTHVNLAITLHRKGETDEAIAEVQEAIRLKDDYVGAHYNLGILLSLRKRKDEAMTAFQRVIKLDPRHADGHHNLASILMLKGRWDEAIAEFRVAIDLAPQNGQSYGGLATALALQGRFAEARPFFQRSLELIPDGDPRRALATKNLQACEKMMPLEQKLPAVLKGVARPADAAEALALAEFCQVYKHYYVAASHLFAEVFAAQPARPRYNGALVAALAGCGQGKDAHSLDEKQRTALRRQALDWLRADLNTLRHLLNKDPDKARPVIKTLQHWVADSDLAGVRGQQALAKLPEAERPDWQKLWADVRDALARAQKNPIPGAK